tara:strand:- start:9547 stop:10002 length:456 start_codon:yes stop_codon:yes gene_type:complete
MANADNPNGFVPVGPNPSVNNYMAGGTFSKGDMVMYSSGKLVIHDGTNALAAGVAAENGSADQMCAIWDGADTEFSGQVDSGTAHVQGTHDGGLSGIAGSTGLQEVDLNGANGTVRVLRQHFVPGSMETGAHARVIFTIAEHVSGSSGRVS